MTSMGPLNSQRFMLQLYDAGKTTVMYVDRMLKIQRSPDELGARDARVVEQPRDGPHTKESWRFPPAPSPQSSTHLPLKPTALRMKLITVRWTINDDN